MEGDDPNSNLKGRFTQQQSFFIPLFGGLTLDVGEQDSNLQLELIHANNITFILPL